MDSSKIVNEILSMLRHGQDQKLVFDYACKALTEGLRASRCVVWTIESDQLVAAEEFTVNGNYCFRGSKLDSQESMATVLEFLSQFPDESGCGVIYVADTAKDSSMHKFSPTLSSLLELGDVRSRLLGQLRSRGIFSGLVEIQKCGKTAHWIEDDCHEFAEVLAALSVVVQQTFDMTAILAVTRDLKLIHEVGGILSDTKDSITAWKEAASLIASHMGFKHAQVYLLQERDGKGVLVPQIENERNEILILTDTENPFVESFVSRAGKIHNSTYTRKPTEVPFFGHEMAFLTPFKAGGQQLGVFGLWQRPAESGDFRPQHRELGLSLAQLLALYAQRLPGAE